MVWLEQIGAGRALGVAYGLGVAIVAQAWRWPWTAIATAVGRRRAGENGVRMPPVSRAWLREHRVDWMKHGGAR